MRKLSEQREQSQSTFELCRVVTKVAIRMAGKPPPSSPPIRETRNVAVSLIFFDNELNELNKKAMTPIDYHNQNEYWQGCDPYKGMTEEERMKAGCLQGAALIVTVIVVMLLCALLGSCKPQERIVTIVTHSTDTLRLTQVQRDSIYMHDSIHVSEKGDTVLIERWHTSWRDRWHSDTVYRARTDSVPYPVEVIKEVPAELTWWQKLRLQAIDFVIYIIIIVLIVYLGKKHLKKIMS